MNQPDGGHPTTALIADDEEDMRLLVRATIETFNNGLTISAEAADGDEALRLWREHRPDVVVLDQRMPGLSGLEVAERILAEAPTQPVVIFSAFLSAEVHDIAHRMGVQAILSKDRLADIPPTIKQLAAA